MSIEAVSDCYPTSLCRIFLPIELAYPLGKVPINVKKVEDMSKVKKYTVLGYVDFYDEILKWPTEIENEDNDGED